MKKQDKIKLVVILVFVVGFIIVLFTNNVANRSARANASGPPVGHTGAPGEFTCDECHTDPNTGTGQILITAPQTYVPGQTYQIAFSHTTSDQTRRRWGFQLTALDSAEDQAGTLQSTGNTTQVLTADVAGHTRQYVEHTSVGTFQGQQNGASWTFNWTAPQTNIGPVTLWAAGNQANNNELPSGDNIYRSFVTIAPASAAADFDVQATPASQTISPGASTSYNINVTPTGGFTGQVSLGISGLPAGANATFNPAAVNINDASAKSSTLQITTTASTPAGSYPLIITAQSGSIQHTANATLVVASNSTVDLSVSQTASPNPALVGVSLAYRITVRNETANSTATGITLTDTLPFGVSFVSSTSTQGSCSGTGPVVCNLGALGPLASAVVTITVTPSAAAGTITNRATVTSNETDSLPANNTSLKDIGVLAPASTPSMLDPALTVRTVASGLDSPISMAFLSTNDLLVLEKSTGKVKRITNGQLQGTVLDLAVNSASERGLLGITLHPNFASNGFVYLYWTESGTGTDTSNVDDVPLLGNRVDRYVWNGSTLQFSSNLIKLRALQADANQTPRGNHNGGVIAFGPDGKLYIIIGDEGRRGLLQNVTTGGTVPDDQFGGPEPDDAHLTGVILRLNDDGTTPTDNPFYNASTTLTGEAAANLKKIYAYGVRNSFGMAFDPLSGYLWTQENGDDAFDELNRVGAGFNGGWIQIMGPVSRIAEYKQIESSRAGGLQQLRWPPSNIADTPQEALARLFMLPGASYTDPEFSWRYAVAPSALGFMRGRALGPQYEGNMFVGASRTTLYNGYLFRFRLSADRRHISHADSNLSDGVADNEDKFDIQESGSLLVGRDFGITTDIETGPNGNLYVVSLSNGAIYEISAALLQFEESAYTVSEGGGSKTITVVRSGDLSRAVTVDYATTDGTASQRSDYTLALGTLRFAPGESRRSFSIFVADDAFTEPGETVNVTLSNPTGGAFLDNQSAVVLTIMDNDSQTPSTNPIDDQRFFVRQHYLDFLNREPDIAGWDFWTDNITKCNDPARRPANQTVAQCIDKQRVTTSAAFFLSPEFQYTGYFVYRMYKGGLGRMPTYLEFMRDAQRVAAGIVVNNQLSGAVIEQNKRSFAAEFVSRQEFQIRYNDQDNLPYVHRLFENTGVNASAEDRAALANGLNTGTETRASVLQKIVDGVLVIAEGNQQFTTTYGKAFYDKEFNNAFVLMEYFGYLRRDPDAAGYQHWLGKLNFYGNYIDAEMVRSFIISPEYRQRFGPQ